MPIVLTRISISTSAAKYVRKYDFEIIFFLQLTKSNSIRNENFVHFRCCWRCVRMPNSTKSPEMPEKEKTNLKGNVKWSLLCVCEYLMRGPILPRIYAIDLLEIQHRAHNNWTKIYFVYKNKQSWSGKNSLFPILGVIVTRCFHLFGRKKLQFFQLNHVLEMFPAILLLLLSSREIVWCFVVVVLFLVVCRGSRNIHR